MSQVRVACVADVPEGEGREFVAAGRIVALFNVKGQLYAMDGICPHAGGPLAKGTLQENMVTCPWHGWQFDVTNGRHCLNLQLQHTCFPITIVGDDVLVDLPAT